MTKRRIYWPSGHPQHDAWELASPAGQLVVRRNHELVDRGRRQCQGWDVWLNGKHLGAIGSRTLAEVGQLSGRTLKQLAQAACCGRYQEFSGLSGASRPNWGGRRANAGRPCKGNDKRIILSTTVDRATVELIDRRRGEASRGEYLDRLVQGPSRGPSHC